LAAFEKHRTQMHGLGQPIRIEKMVPEVGEKKKESTGLHLEVADDGAGRWSRAQGHAPPQVCATFIQ